jgi:LCP family protein required for cell wall assembly
MPETAKGEGLAAGPQTLDTASAPHAVPVGQRRQRAWRILIRSMVALIAVAVIVTAGLYAVVNHLESNIRRIPVALTAAPQDSKRLTVLITSLEVGPTGLPGASADTATGLIMLLHLNADGETGGVVSIPPVTVVRVPGHGKIAIQNATFYGGPSLLVRTVQQLTGVPVNRFARVDFNRLTDIVNSIGGVDVTVSKAFTSFGHRFAAGVDHIGGVTALYYARDPAISERTRVLRQQNLLRAAINKIVHVRLLTNPIETINLLNALTSALTVDSNFSNTQLYSLVSSFRNIASNQGTFVTAPTHVVNGKQVLNSAVSSQLWAAVKNDSIAAFATQNPSTVTPTTVP